MQLFVAVAALVSALVCTAATSDNAAGATAGTEEAVNAVVDSANAFAYDLYRVASKEAGNAVLCPLSAAAVLTLAWHGAGGTTAQQLGDALRLPLPRDRRLVADGYRELLRSLQGATSSAEGGMQLRVANRMFAQKGFRVSDAFRQTAVGSFGADAEELDFAADAASARRAVNRWVEDYTRGKIADLLGEGSPTATTLLILVNAVYFKAGWDKSFQEEKTRMDIFHKSEDVQVNVPTMHKYGEFMYAELPKFNCKVMALNYRANEEDDIRTKMVIILPNSVNGLRDVEAGLSNLNLNHIQWERRNVNVSLPKFRIEVTHQLNDMLTQLGVSDLFTRNADLRGLTEKPVYVSKAVQKTFIEVNEKGTEASAATGLEFVFFSGPPPKADFIVDRPFLFFVIRGNLILFMGRVTAP